MLGRNLKLLLLAAALGLVLSLSPTAHPQDKSLPLAPGDVPPRLDLEAILQAPPKAKATWDKLRGNIIVLEFWATWCGPCRAALPHLNGLAERYKNKPVRFISITDEEEWRVRNFLKVTPIKGWIGLDRDRSAHKAYGVGMIPHTVLVDRDGKLAAVGQPSDVSEEVLDRMLAGQPAALPPAPPLPPPPTQTPKASEQADQAPALVELLIKPAPASSSMSFSGNVFKARGMALKTLLAEAYGVPRVTVLTDGPGNDETYQAAARVPIERSDLLRPLLQKGLAAALGISVRRETREMDVLVLAVPEKMKPTLRPGQSQTENPILSDDGQISGTSSSLRTFCLVLQDALNRVVLDETGLEGAFDIALYWDFRNTNSVFKEIREQLGLELRPAKRSIEVLIYEKKTVQETVH